MYNLLILSILAIVPFPLTYLIPYPLTVFYLIPLIYQIFRTIKEKPIFLKEKTIEILSLFCLLFFVFDSIFISRRIILVSIHLTMGLVLIKAFNLKTKKDKDLFLLLLFFLISAGIANSFHITLFPYILICLFYFLKYLMEEVGVEKKKSFSFSLSILFLSSLISTLFFVFFPRTKAPYVPGIGFKEEAFVIRENELSLNDIENLKSRNEILMRVKFNRKIERGMDFYIRLKSFSRYSNGIWSEQKPEYKLLMSEKFGVFEFSKKKVEYEVELFSRVFFQNLPLFYGTTRIEIPLEFLNRAKDGTILLPTSWQKRRLKYKLHVKNQPFLFQNNEPTKEEEKTFDLEKIKKIAKEIFENETGDLKKIEKLLSYFYKNYKYGVENFNLEDFLDKKVGHCELFATACALILREGGIPSRVVVGWLGGEKHPWQNYIIIRGKNSHAWVEIWIQDKWILIDPTPPDFRPPLTEGNISAILKYLFESISFFWDRNILGFTYLEQMDILNFLKENSKFIFKIINLFLLLIFVILIFLFLKKLRIKREKFYLRYYKKLRNKAIRKLKIPEGITPENLSFILKDLKPEKGLYIDKFFKLYLDSSFGNKKIDKKEIKYYYKKIRVL